MPQDDAFHRIRDETRYDIHDLLVDCDHEESRHLKRSRSFCTDPATKIKKGRGRPNFTKSYEQLYRDPIDIWLPDCGLDDNAFWSLPLTTEAAYNVAPENESTGGEVNLWDRGERHIDPNEEDKSDSVGIVMFVTFKLLFEV